MRKNLIYPGNLKIFVAKSHTETSQTFDVKDLDFIFKDTVLNVNDNFTIVTELGEIKGYITRKGRNGFIPEAFVKEQWPISLRKASPRENNKLLPKTEIKILGFYLD